jgi:hypothetical protein
MESMIVMRGLAPRIHLFDERWNAGSSPAMTLQKRFCQKHETP